MKTLNQGCCEKRQPFAQFVSAVALLTVTGRPPAYRKRRSSNGNLTKSTYGNTHVVEYEYNDYGQTAKIKKNGAEKYLWSYNSTGMPFSHTYKENNRVYTYEYYFAEGDKKYIK